MCYRFSNIQEEKEFREHMRQLGKIFKHTTEEAQGRFSFFHTNGFAHEKLPVISEEKPDVISYMNWGLIPSKTKTRADKDKIWKMGYTLNARSEEIFTTWSFKDNIRSHRCLVPATGFFEWRDYNKVKYPYLIQVHKAEEFQSFFFQGIYDYWTDKETGEHFESFSILTCAANPMLKKVHVNLSRPDLGGRMPVIIADNDFDKWLNPDATEKDIKELMKPYPEEQMYAYTISKDITSRKVNPDRAETLSHVHYDELKEESSFNAPCC